MGRRGTHSGRDRTPTWRGRSNAARGDRRVATARSTRPPCARPGDLTRRLRPGRGRLGWLVDLPAGTRPAGTLAVELALVASATAPLLRRLTVFRRVDLGACPDGAPRAA